MPKVLGFILLLPFVRGYSVHRATDSVVSPYKTSWLQLRQDQPPNAVCVAPCTSESCGGADFCSPNPDLEARSLSLPDWGQESSWALSFRSFRNTSHQDGDLDKRLFTYKAGSTNQDDYTGDTEPTEPEAVKYLFAVSDGEEINNFGNQLRLVSATGDERAVSKQREFKNLPFQIVSQGVYGCTVVVLVSNRGVWASHLWEIYSSGTAQDELGADNANDPAFDDRVLKFMRGQAVSSPAPGDPEHPYITPSGPGIKADFFNKVESDQTTLYIITAMREGSATYAPENINQPTHYGKDGDVVKTVTAILGHKPRVVIVPYWRANPYDPDEAPLFETTTRGRMLFQYDPNSDGNNKKAWRMFIENRFDYKAV